MALSVDTTPAKHVTVLRNGDSNFGGRKFVVSRRRYRTFDALLSDITCHIGAPFGAVRRLYTPKGGRRIGTIEELQGGSTYVAGGSERFKKVNYDNEPNSVNRNWGFASVKRPGFLADEPPPLILPKKNRRYAQRSAQFYKVHQPVQFTVFRNGMPQERGFKFLLKPREMREYDTVLSIISMKIRLVEGAVRRLYSINGMPVIGISDIVDGGAFVACGNRKYIPASYGMLISAQIPKPQKLPVVKRLRQVENNSNNRTQSNPLPAIQKKPIQETKAKSEKDSPIPVPEEEEEEVVSRGSQADLDPQGELPDLIPRPVELLNDLEPQNVSELEPQNEQELIPNPVDLANDLQPQNELPLEPQNEPELEPQNELPLEPQNEPELEPQNEPQLEPQNEPELESQNEPELEPQNEPQLESQNEPQLEPQNEPELEPQNELQLEPQNDPELELQNLLELEPQSELELEPQNENEPELELQNEPELEYQNEREATKESGVEEHEEPPAKTPTADTPKVKSKIQNGIDSEGEDSISKTTVNKKSVKKAESKPGVNQGTELLHDTIDKDSVFKGNKNEAKEGDFLSNVETESNGVFKPKNKVEEADEVIEDKGLVEEKPIDLQQAEEVEEDLK